MDNEKSSMERAKEALDGIGDQVSENIHETMERSAGEIWFTDDDAPDRDEYDELEDGYARYLEDCHEWTLREFQSVYDRLEETVFAIDAEAYPTVGLNRRQDDEIRKEVDQLLADAMIQLDELGTVRERLTKIENAYNDR